MWLRTAWEGEMLNFFVSFFCCSWIPLSIFFYHSWELSQFSVSIYYTQADMHKKDDEDSSLSFQPSHWTLT